MRVNAHRYSLARCLLLLTTLLAGPSPADDALRPPVADDVRVSRRGEVFRIEIDLQTPAAPATAWAVLTDFERMASFVPNLERSRVLERQGNHLRIEQQGKAWFGPFSLSFGSTREVELLPMQEIRAQQLTGTARAMSSTMRLIPDGSGTRLEYRADVTPDGSYLVTLLGPAAIRHETAEQFAAILREIARRDGLAEPPVRRVGEAAPAVSPGSAAPLIKER